MVGDFLQKMQLARAEFEQGKAIREILFSDNPGIIPRVSTPVVTRPTVTRPTVTRPTVTPPVVAPTPIPARVSTPAPAPTPIVRPIVAPVSTQKIEEIKRSIAVAEAERARAVVAEKGRAEAERARQATEEAKRRVAAKIPEPPTGVLATLGRGLARVTGAKTEPPRGYEWYRK